MARTSVSPPVADPPQSGAPSGIAGFVSRVRGYQRVSRPAAGPEALSARADAFAEALATAERGQGPRFGDIALAPAWLALPVAAQRDLVMLVGALAHRDMLAGCVDGALLQALAQVVGDARLDGILATSAQIAESPEAGEPSLAKIEQDGQCILLATLPLALRPALMAGAYFQRTDPASVARWQPLAADLLAQSAQL